MIGRRLPLKTKLILALLGPLLALGVLGGVQVRQLRADAQLADSQRTQVDDNIAIVEVLTAVRSERDAQLTVSGVSGAPLVFARVRNNTDQRIETVLEDPNLSQSTRQRVIQIQTDLERAREAVVVNTGGVRAALIEEMTNPNFDMVEDSTMGGLGTFDRLVGEMITLLDVEPSSLVDPETAVDLTSLDVVAQFDELVRQEALTYMQLSILPIEEQPASLVLQAQILGGQVEALEATVLLVASDSYRGEFTNLLSSTEYENFRALRADVLSSQAGEVVVSERTIRTFLNDLSEELNAVNGEILVGARANADTAEQTAQRNLVVGASLMALLALVVGLIAFSSYRSIRRPLLKLTERSREIADTELPAVVALLRQEGLEADVPEIVPIEAETSDEIGGLVLAFNDMHRTAVELASEQAAARRTVAEMFVNLGRRNQKLLTRILTYLDSLEQEERDPEMLEKLFKVDHLATRMRRNAESLLVLAGARASRVFGEPVPIADVARSALAEVEGYERVHLDIRGDAYINGDAVADLAHLLAELMENALSFSPPTSPVVVIATATPIGYYMAVADQGIGMSTEDFEAANTQISAALTLEETPSKFLGHHVVGRLAARHGIEVQLIEGLVTGVTARIMLPASVLASVDGESTNELEAPQDEFERPSLAVDSEIARALERVDPNLGEGELSAAEWGRVNTITTNVERPAWLEPIDEESSDDLGVDAAHHDDAAGSDAADSATSDEDESDAAPRIDSALAALASTPIPTLAPEPAPTPAVFEDQTPPPGRDVLDTSLLPRRRRGEGEDEESTGLSFGDQVASAERRRGSDPEQQEAASEPMPASGAEDNGEFALARRSPGATRASQDVSNQPPARKATTDESPDEPHDVKKAGQAFASSLVGFQQGVTRATGSFRDADDIDDNSEHPRSQS